MRKETLSAVLMVIAVILFGLAVASCAPDTSAPTLAARTPVATSAVSIVEPVVIADAAGTPIASLEPFTDTACLDCHTNQEQLELLAVEEEDEHASLSSGPG